MNKKINFKKEKKLPIFIIILSIFMLLFLLNCFTSDGMESKGIKNVYYKTYSDDNGWTSWKKNGMTSGNKKGEIKNIKIKMLGEQTTIKIYNNNKWKTLENNEEFYGISLLNSAKLLKKYDVCYRTYNQKNGWLNWICSYGEFSGNSKYKIKAIQVKIIPKGVVKEEYLKDYSKNKNEFKIGF